MPTINDGFNFKKFLQSIKDKKEQERLENERIKQEALRQLQEAIRTGTEKLKSSEEFYNSIVSALTAAADKDIDFFETDATNKITFPFSGLGDVIDAVGLENASQVLSGILTEMLGFKVEYSNPALMGDRDGSTVGSLIRRGKEEDMW